MLEDAASHGVDGNARAAKFMLSGKLKFHRRGGNFEISTGARERLFFSRRSLVNLITGLSCETGAKSGLIISIRNGKPYPWTRSSERVN